MRGGGKRMKELALEVLIHTNGRQKLNNRGQSARRLRTKDKRGDYNIAKVITRPVFGK
jgi:hypothetical protein